MTLILYTDGACKAEHMFGVHLKGKPIIESLGKGGWAWWVDDDFWDCGAVPETTNNRMEMLAVIQGLLAVNQHRPHDRLLVVSDSAYVVNCFADRWHVRWRENGWTNSAGKPVKNRDLWERLIDLYETHQNVVTFRKVRGHGRGGPGDAPYVAGNHRADRLAVHARKTLERDGDGPTGRITLPDWMA